MDSSFRNVQDGAGSKREDCYETFAKLVGKNSVNLMILRNFQHWYKFLFSCKKKYV